MLNQSQRVQKIHVSPIRKVAGLLDEARGQRDMISFGGGAPSVPPPIGLLEEFTRLLQSNPLRSCGYTGTRGIPELREAIAKDARQYGHVSFDPATEIIVTTGATEAIYNIVMALVDSEDEVVLTDPTYLGYREMIELAQGRPKFLPVSVDESYQPDGEELKKVVSKRTKAVIALSPDNPTGRILKEGFVKALVDLAADFDFWIISDDIYKHFVYEGEHVWISHFANAKDRTVTVCSFSKEACVPGLRLGYTLAPSSIIDSMEKMQQYSTLAPETLGQFALVKFLDENMKDSFINTTILPQYLRRRDLMATLLNQNLPLARTAKPQGAFYFFVDMRPYLSKLDMNEEDFASRLLGEAGVAVIPGRFFGKNGRNHIRLTFVTESDQRIEAGIQKMAEFVHANQ